MSWLKSKVFPHTLSRSLCSDFLLSFSINLDFLGQFDDVLVCLKECMEQIKRFKNCIKTSKSERLPFLSIPFSFLFGIFISNNSLHRGFALVGENLLEFVSLCKETLSLQNSLTLIASHQGCHFSLFFSFNSFFQRYSFD